VPLKRGTGRDTISDNIRRLIREGYPPDQAAAIAYDIASELSDEARPGATLDRQMEELREHLRSLLG